MDRNRLNKLCKDKKITIAELEKNLKLSNGSLRKDVDIKSERLLSIAEYFNVSMEYLMGKDLINGLHESDIEFFNDYNSLNEEQKRQLVLMLAFLKEQHNKK